MGEDADTKFKETMEKLKQNFSESLLSEQNTAIWEYIFKSGYVAGIDYSLNKMKEKR